jgi:hypothetical protein
MTPSLPPDIHHETDDHRPASPDGRGIHAATISPGRKGLKNVKPQIKIARKAYTLFKAQKQLVHDIFPAGHQWHGKQALLWVMNQLSSPSHPN